MPDIFISYNREDRDMARLFATALEAEGLSVWWDAALRAGETYDEVTEQNLRTAGAVVVLWSKRSANSKWVRAEATVGERCSTLVPALIEDCERPIRFELVQTADLRHWRGDRADPHWRAFMQDIRTAISKKGAKPQTVAPQPAAHDASIETAFWTSIKDSRDRAEFEAYLKRYPNGNFASLAQNRLAALTRAAPAPAKPQAPPQQRAAAPAKQAPPAAKAKKSGNGLLVLGLFAGIGVIGAVAYLMMTGKGEVVAEASPAAPQAPQAIEEAADAPAKTTLARTDAEPPDVPTVEAAPVEDTGLEIAASEPAPIGEPVIEAKEDKAEGPFKDCDSCPLMTPLPGGTFKMGSPSSEAGHNAYEGPQRDVTVKSFAIGVHEVTNAEWRACVEDNACGAKPGDDKDNFPALYISWREATAYADWLTKKTGRKYRLPTEAEWEYAARGGGETAYWWGDKFERSRVTTSSVVDVGSSAANPYGLYDTASNAREWVADCYVNNFVNAPMDGSAVKDGDCGMRVIRGGSWLSNPVDMRVANRSRIDINVKSRYMGVRVAAELNE